MKTQDNISAALAALLPRQKGVHFHGTGPKSPYSLPAKSSTSGKLDNGPRQLRASLTWVRMMGMAGMMAFLALSGCHSKPQPAATETTAEPTLETGRLTLSPMQSKSIGIETGTIRLGQVRSLIRANGVLDVPPQNMVSITAPFGGFLKNTTLLAGTRVSRGQLIATLENPEFITMQQDFLETKSQTTYLESEFQRQTTLAAENVNAKKTLEKARADYETMKARLSGQRAKLEMLHIDMDRLEKGEIVKEVSMFSPISGYVTEMKVNIGSFVQPTDALFKIADTGHLHAELTLYEQDITRLAIGQKVDIEIGNETRVRKGTIHLLGREVGPDRSVKVHVHFDEEDQLLIPGTFLSAQIEVLANDVPTLPESAVVQFEGQNYVFAVVQGTADTYEMVPVQTGQSEAGFVEIKWDRQRGDSTKIVTTGAYGLLAKLKNTDEE